MKRCKYKDNSSLCVKDYDCRGFKTKCSFYEPTIEKQKLNKKIKMVSLGSKYLSIIPKVEVLDPCYNLSGDIIGSMVTIKFKNRELDLYLNKKQTYKFYEFLHNHFSKIIG